MDIVYVGHACFLVRFKTGFSVCFDPYKPGSVPGLTAPNVVADEVFCSHSHDDHGDFGAVSSPDDRYTGPEAETEIIKTFHDDVQGAARGRNNITIVKVRGEKAVHMGDIGCDLTEEQIDRIRGCDLLMIPVGGFFTINCRQAFRMVQQTEPKAVVPMHYRGKGFGYDVISGREEFVELFEKEGKRKIFSTGRHIEGLPEDKSLLLMEPLRIL